MLIGPHSSRGATGRIPREDSGRSQKLHRQPTITLSAAPCFMNGRIEPRHVICGRTFSWRESHHLCREAYPSRVASGFPGGEFIQAEVPRTRGFYRNEHQGGPAFRVADSLYWMSAISSVPTTARACWKPITYLMLNPSKLSTEERWHSHHGSLWHRARCGRH